MRARVAAKYVGRPMTNGQSCRGTGHCDAPSPPASAHALTTTSTSHSRSGQQGDQQYHGEAGKTGTDGEGNLRSQHGPENAKQETGGQCGQTGDAVIQTVGAPTERAGNEVGDSLVPGAWTAVGPGYLGAPSIVAPETGEHAE